MNRDEIIEKISEHISTRGGLPRDWYVGICQNPERCLPVNHKMELNMNYLWQFCDSFGDLKCDPEITKTFRPKQLEEGENIPIWPVGTEQEKLNRICMQCKSAQIFIKKRECPICGSNEIYSGILKAIAYGTNSPSRTIYFYECMQCKRRLYALEELK